MTAKLLNEFAPVPTIERGKSYHLGGDTKNAHRFIYSAGQLVIMRDIQHPINCYIYKEHKHPVTCARLSPSGSYMASADISKKIIIWDTLGEDKCIKLEKMSVGNVTDIAWSPDSKRVVVAGSGSGGIHGDAFMIDGGASVGTLVGHGKPMLSIDYKPDRPFRVATGSQDGKANLYEGPPFKTVQTASAAHAGKMVTCVRFSPNNEKLVSVGTDKKIVFYSADKMEVIKEIPNAHDGGIYGVSWSSNSQYILTASADKTCKKWNAEDGALITTFKLGSELTDQQLGCVWVGDNLLSINLGGDISILDEQNPNKPFNVIQGHSVFVEALAYDSSSQRFFSGDRDGKIVCWDVNNAKNYPLTGAKHASKIFDLLVVGNDLISVAMDDTIRVTSLTNLTYSPGIKLPSQPLGGLAYSNGAIFIACKEHIVTFQNGQITATVPVEWSPTCIAAVGTVVAVGGSDKNLYVYENNGGKLTVIRKTTHVAPLSSCAISPDGALVAGGDSTKNFVIWKGTEKLHSGNMSARIDCMNFSPYGDILACGSLDSSFSLFSLSKNSTAHNQQKAHVGGVKDLVFVNNNTILSTGQDCVTRKWEINI